MWQKFSGYAESLATARTASLRNLGWRRQRCTPCCGAQSSPCWRIWTAPRERIRYKWKRPSELVHLDVKKLGRFPEGGGIRFAPGFRENGAGYSPPKKHGHDCIRIAVDDHSRYAYVEALPDERGETTAGFLRRMNEAFLGSGHHGRTSAHRHWRQLPLQGLSQSGH